MPPCRLKQRWRPVPNQQRPQSALAWEQQKWRDEYQLKIRELDLKQKEQERSTWSNPLVLAILAAAIAGLSNAVIAMINGRLQRQIEQTKAAALFGSKKVDRRPGGS